MTTPAVRPESATLSTNALGYVDIANIDPPAGYIVPNRADAETQALLVLAAERRAPDAPLRVVPTATGFALADMDSYRRWWALRQTGSGIGQVKAEWVAVVVDGVSEAPEAAEPERPTVPIAPRSMSPVRIALEALTVDPGLQTRAAMNDATVAEYAEALLAGEVLPAVVVFRDGEGIWLADGFHRVAAAKHAGLADIEAVVHDGGRREAMLHAVGANARHGLRRTNADKRRAVELLLADAEWSRWSDRAIAEKCGVDHKTVGAIRAGLTGEIPQCSTRHGADGRTTDTTRIGRTRPTTLDRVAERESHGPEIDFPPGATAPANEDVALTDDAQRSEQPVKNDTECVPAARRAAELEAAGATVVRLLTALAVDRPVDARTFAKRHRAAVAAATNPRH